MLILTSDGLTTDSLLKQFQQALEPDFQKVAIITTASNPFAERHPDIDRNIEIMKKYGLISECIDIENQDPNILLNYDVIIIIGGNPYYLLNIMQKRNCKSLFEKLLASGKIIVGMSAGSIVLGTTIDFVSLLTPEMHIEMDNYSGLSLVDMVICPHASTFVASIENSANKLSEYERNNNRIITRVNDGQAIFMEGL